MDHGDGNEMEMDMNLSLRDFLTNINMDFFERLDGGGYGEIYSVVSRNGRFKKAVKQIVLDRVETRASFECERRAFEKLGRHDNICQTQDISIIRNCCGFILMPLYENGDLDTYRRRRRGTNVEVDHIIEGMMKGVKYMHSKGLIHADLKPKNVLIDNNGGSKIADFGLIVVLLEGEVQRNNFNKGTEGYKSPEVCLHSFIKKESDIYGLGLTIYELVGNRPFLRYENSNDLPIEEMYRNAHEELVRSQVRHRTMLLRMLNSAEYMRPTAEQCLVDLRASQRAEAAAVAGAPE